MARAQRSILKRLFRPLGVGFVARCSLDSHMFPTISLFSGSMGFDLGLEKAGFNTRVCVEIDRDCVETLRLNRPELPVIGQDIRQVSTEQILATARLKVGEAFCVAGGPPCQSFSSGGKRSSILDPRGSLFTEFVRVVREAAPQYFIFENVANIVTAAVSHRPIAERPGQSWNLSSYSDTAKNRSGIDDTCRPLERDELAGSAIRVILAEFEGLGYDLTFGVLNAADFGVPQKRLRFVLIGSRGGKGIHLPRPTHAERPTAGRQRWATLRDALKSLHESHPLHSNYTAGFEALFDQVPPGSNWRALPPALQRSAMGNAFDSGGGKTGFFRRLSWDEPAPTIVGKPNRKSCALCHPDQTRPLTVRECARVQGFPDDWQFAGGMHRQYLQVGNAVPVGLGEAVGLAILQSDATPARRHETHARAQIDAEALLADAQRVLRASARNRISRAAPQQTALF